MQFKKLINGDLISPPDQYPVDIEYDVEVIIDGNVIIEKEVKTIYFCYNYSQLTPEQISQLQQDGWKQYIVNYNAESTELIETSDMIIQNYKKIDFDPYDTFNIEKAYNQLGEVFFYKAVSNAGMCSMILSMNETKSFYSLYQYVLCKYYDGRDESDPENIIQGLVSDTEWNAFMKVYSDQGIDLSKEPKRA